MSEGRLKKIGAVKEGLMRLKECLETSEVISERNHYKHRMNTVGGKPAC